MYIWKKLQNKFKYRRGLIKTKDKRWDQRQKTNEDSFKNNCKFIFESKDKKNCFQGLNTENGLKKNLNN